MSIELHEGDNRASLRRLIDRGVRVHSVVTDPPYGLTSIQKRFGAGNAKAARTDGNDGSFARLSGGFMGKHWDGTGIERDPEFWRLIWEILLPGGYVFAFSGARTGHWQACAMETAGFIMHPMHGWVNNQGFPKAHAANKAIDKMLGRSGEMGDWEGWAYGTQAQKPALEPIYLAQKPFSEKTGAANLLKHGVGAVNIDGCRVATSDNLNGGAYAENGNRGESPSLHGGSGMNVPGKTVGKPFVQPKGRHPANLFHDGSAEVVALFPNSGGQQGDLSASGKSKEAPNDIYGDFGATSGHPARNDSGSSSRFFNSFPVDMGCIISNPKAGKADRAGSKHPTVKPITLMQHLIRHITPPGGTVLDPFAGSGTTGEAARLEGVNCILMEAEPEYLDFLRGRFSLPSGQPTAAFDDILGTQAPSTKAEHLFGDLL